MLALTVASGSGMGVFSMLADGMYSAIFLFFFPFLSLLMFASIAFDIANPHVAAVRPRVTKAATGAGPLQVATRKPLTTALG
jgi:hypothetical protein